MKLRWCLVLVAIVFCVSSCSAFQKKFTNIKNSESGTRIPSSDDYESFSVLTGKVLSKERFSNTWGFLMHVDGQSDYTSSVLFLCEGNALSPQGQNRIQEAVRRAIKKSGEKKRLRVLYKGARYGATACVTDVQTDESGVKVVRYEAHTGTVLRMVELDGGKQLTDVFGFYMHLDGTPKGSSSYYTLCPTPLKLSDSQDAFIKEQMRIALEASNLVSASVLVGVRDGPSHCAVAVQLNY